MVEPRVYYITEAQNALLDESLHTIGLPPRLINALEEHLGILTVEQLLQHTMAEILSVQNIGDKSGDVILAQLEKFGFCTRGPDPQASRRGDVEIARRRKMLRDTIGAIRH